MQTMKFLPQIFLCRILLLGSMVMMCHGAYADEKINQDTLPIQLVRKLNYLNKLNLNTNPQFKPAKQNPYNNSPNHELAQSARTTNSEQSVSAFYIPPYQYKMLSRLKPYGQMPRDKEVAQNIQGAAPPKDGRASLDDPALSNENVQQAKRFCQVLANGLKDQLLDAQKARLLEIKDEIDKKMSALNARIGDYKQILKERDDQLKKIDDNLIAIYSKMRPDTAAAQLALLENKDAATILFKLSPKTSSTILNEMDPNKAAQLTQIITTLNFSDHSDNKS